MRSIDNDDHKPGQVSTVPIDRDTEAGRTLPVEHYVLYDPETDTWEPLLNATVLGSAQD